MHNSRKKTKDICGERAQVYNPVYNLSNITVDLLVSIYIVLSKTKDNQI